MYAITGITGKVGGVVARTLLAAGLPVRAVARDCEKGRPWAAKGCEIAIASIADADGLTKAFSGADAVFLMTPPDFDPEPGFPITHEAIKSIKTAIAAAQPAKVVFLSTVGAQVAEFNLLNNSELQLRMMIVPHQVRWPAPEYLHWQRLHAAANEARERVSEFYTLADAIDRNADLSRDGKYRQRSKIAAQAIANFDASKTLARAHEAVERVVAKHKMDQQVSPEIAKDRDATVKAMKEVEQDWPKAMDKIAERAGLSKSPGIRR